MVGICRKRINAHTTFNIKNYIRISAEYPFDYIAKNNHYLQLRTPCREFRSSTSNIRLNHLIIPQNEEEA